MSGSFGDVNMEKIYLCAFADSRMPQTLKRVGRQALESGFFKGIYLYNEHSLSESFQRQFARQLQWNIRGFGYWVWKPYIILETLNKIPNDAILLYMDAGCHLNPKGEALFKNFVDKVSTNDSGVLVAELTDDCLESYYTKGDLLDYFCVRDREDITLTAQRAATTFFLRKEEKNLQLIRDWLSVFETDYHLIDDTPSVSPNMVGFIENRHDQSVFSILTKLRSVETFSFSILENRKDSPILILRDKKIKLIYRYSLRRFIGKVIHKIWKL